MAVTYPGNLPGNRPSSLVAAKTSARHGKGRPKEMPPTPEPDREASACLATARRLRHALTERDKVVRPQLERYDSSQADLRVLPEKRVKIAGGFMRAALRADHIYEESVNEALDEYRELMSGGE
jgi:hypothetical protein